MPVIKSESTADEYTARGCSHLCRTESWCRSFAIEQLTSDAVKHQICHMYRQSRNEFQNNGQLVYGDSTWQLYENLPFAETVAGETAAGEFVISPLSDLPPGLHFSTINGSEMKDTFSSRPIAGCSVCCFPNSGRVVQITGKSCPQ